MKDPAFLFYPEAFLVGTMDMTNEEVGVYIRLLCRQHQKGHIPESRIKTVPEEVQSKFTKDENGLYYNERLDKEIEKRQKYTESRRNNGAKGGRPKNEPYGEPTENHMDNHMQNHMQTDRLSVAKPTENHIINRNRNINKNINNKEMVDESGTYQRDPEAQEKLDAMRKKIQEANNR